MINYKTKRTILTYLKSECKVPYIEIKGIGDIHSAPVLEYYVPLMEAILEDFKRDGINEIEIVDGSKIENHVPRYPVPADISKKFKEMEKQYNGITEEPKVEKVEYNCTVHPIRPYDAIEAYILAKK